MYKFIFLLLLFCFRPAEALKAQSDTGRVIRILAIGNSFSDDAVEYLDELAEAAGIRAVIGNLYIGGCSLERHWNNASKNTPAYDYRKSNEGRFTNTPKASLEMALKDQPWDYITFQQVSQLSGLFNTYYPYLPLLMQYVRTHTTNPSVQFGLQQGWAYAANSTHKGFLNYHNDQQSMYEAIVKTTKRVARKEKIAWLIPTGTAIQTGRNLVGDLLNRDGFHLDYKLGRYIAACLWYEIFFGNVIGNSYHPEGVSQIEANLAQRIAHTATSSPYKAVYGIQPPHPKSK